jgi:hypothetical protein
MLVSSGGGGGGGGGGSSISSSSSSSISSARNLSQDSQCHDKDSKSGTFRAQVKVMFGTHIFDKIFANEIKIQWLRDSCRNYPFFFVPFTH